MSLTVLIPLLLFIIGNAILALVIAINNPGSWTNRLFSFLIVVLTIYLVFNSYLNESDNYAVVVFLSRAIISVGAIINFLVFIFLHTFPQHDITLKKVFLAILIPLTGVLFVAGFTPLIFSDVTTVNGAVAPTPGILMPVFLLHTVLLVFGGLIQLFLKYRKAEGLEKRKIQFVLLSFFVLFTLIIVFNFVLPTFLKFGNFIPFLPLYLLIFNIIVAYSIIRHRLLDIRLAVARSIGYILTIIIVGSLYSVGFYLFDRFVLQNSVSLTTLMVSVVYMLITTFSFQILRQIIEKVTEGVFYHHSYDQQKLLEDLTRIMAGTLRLEDVTKSVLNELLESVQISWSTLSLIKDKKIISAQNVHLDRQRTPAEDAVMVELAEHIFHRRQEKFLIFQEVTEEDHEIKEQMRSYGYQMVLLLIVDNQLLGALFLGAKSGGTVFSTQDIEVLKIFAPQFAVAVNNALSYEEISRFNITLKEEIKKATHELEEANDKLKELDKLKDEFVSLASHELRTPMSSIKGSLSLILEGYAGDISDKARKYLTAAFNENDRLVRLVNNLLNSSRIEAGRFTFTVSDVDLGKVITEVVANMQTAADEKKIYLKFETKEQDLMVRADNDKIREVVINLIGNALKFTTEGGITVSAAKKDGMVVTSVTDTGPGMSEEALQKLFKKFSQVHNTAEKPVGGTGLGLYISKQIVDGLQGKIWVESTVNKGSTFSFSLPTTTGKATESDSKQLTPST